METGVTTVVLERPLRAAFVRGSAGLYLGFVRAAESGETSKALARLCNTGEDAGSDSRPESSCIRAAGVGGLVLAPASGLRLWYRKAIYSFCLLNKY